MSAVIIFDFEDSSVRSMVIDGEPWFVGKDVCGCLGIANHSHALARLEEDERRDGVAIGDPIGRQQFPVLVSEPGIYRLVFTSRSAAAERFKRWLAHEVLPAIRRTGRFEIGQTSEASSLIMDELARAVPILREWRILYGWNRARQLAKSLPIPQVEADDEIVMMSADNVGLFARDCLVPAQGQKMRPAELYEAYLAWCEDREAQAVSPAMLGRRLGEAGWRKIRSNGTIWYLDVARREAATAELLADVT